MEFNYRSIIAKTRLVLPTIDRSRAGLYRTATKASIEWKELSLAAGERAATDYQSDPPMNNTQPTARTQNKSTAWMLVFAAWLVASVSALGSLFFSEIMQLPPCALCWYQRVFMFPLVLILPIGLFPSDRKVVRYALPLAVVGWLFAVFQMLLVAGIVPEKLEPCTQGVPCSETVIEWFGFVTIPLLSAAAFSAIIALLVLTHFRGSQ